MKQQHKNSLNRIKDKAENKAKGGRPPKLDDKLNRSVNLKLTAKDYTLLKEKAERLGMNVTGYAREMTLKGEIKSRFTLEELDRMRKLSGMANNLNQIARQANISGFAQVGMEIADITLQIKKLLNKDDR